MKNQQRFWNSLLAFSSLMILLFAVFLNFSEVGAQQFSYLASSFLQGKTYFLQNPGSWEDAVFFNSRNYWPLGPFPAVLLMPFVYVFSLLNKFFHQGYLHFFIVLGVFYLVYKIARKVKYAISDSLYLAFAFCFASVFLGVAIWAWSWHFSHVITVFLLFLAIYEYLGKRRYWLIGLILGLIMTTRVTASLFFVFFVLEIILISKARFFNKANNLFKLLIPYLVSFLLLTNYNFIRFGNFVEQGYGLANLLPPLAKARDYGLFSLIHLPGNLYYFLLSFPLPVFRDNLSHVLKFPYFKANSWGMSIFITSPYYIYLLFLRHKDVLSKTLLLTVFLISLPIFLYFSIGARQFGYRYSLDFLPLLFFLFIRSYRKQYKVLTYRFKILVLITAFTNLYLFLADFI